MTREDIEQAERIFKETVIDTLVIPGLTIRQARIEFAIQTYNAALEEVADEVSLYSPSIIPERVRALKIK